VKVDSCWPARPRPLPDELLSSWLMRIAAANGQKLQAFCDCAFGKERQLWNRDVDRLAPRWLISELSFRTGLSILCIRGMTLNAYCGTIFRHRQLSGQLRWILPLRMYHRKRLGFGIQFCPTCLAEDDEKPYFRRRWRVAYCTCCLKHNSLLRDRCPSCLAPVAFHRRELGRPEVLDAGPMYLCHNCDYDLRRTPVADIPVYDPSAYLLMRTLVQNLEVNQAAKHRFGVGFHDTLHQMCKIIASHRPGLGLKQFVEGQLHISAAALEIGRFPFENRSVSERHYVVSLALWVMSDMRRRLRAAWKSGAVRYNALLKDLDPPPRRLVSMTDRFNRNRASSL